MTHPDIEYLIAQERMRDDMRIAEQHRLVRAALLEVEGLPQPRRARFSLRPLMLALARSLSFIGDRMHAWSCQLEYRYRLAASTGSQSSPCQ